jgi:hypothetical protein
MPITFLTTVVLDKDRTPLNGLRRPWLQGIRKWLLVGGFSTMCGLGGCTDPSDGGHQRSQRDPGSKLDAGTAVIIPVQMAPALLDQCTRERPRNVTGFWSPGADIVRQMEEDLAPVLHRASREGGSGSTGLNAYYRQYVGILRDGRRVIYVNGFHRNYVHRYLSYNDTVHGKRVEQDTAEWRINPVSVCDGGTAYFGIEYDLTTRRFGPLHFNAKL